jgi:serine/threonine protein phosphatase 1
VFAGAGAGPADTPDPMSKFLRLPRNETGRDFVCGDIHGMYDLLDRALEAVAFDPAADRLLAVGDLFDRGPRSLDYAHYLEQPWFHTILGNHELMAVNAIADPNVFNIDTWLQNGGDWITSQPPSAYVDLLARIRVLPLALETETPAGRRIGLTHAEMPDVPWDQLRATLESWAEDDIGFDQDPLAVRLLWARSVVSRGRAGPVAGIDHVFHGHTPLEEVRRIANRTYLDLGAYRTGELCVLEADAYLDRLEAA